MKDVEITEDDCNEIKKLISYFCKKCPQRVSVKELLEQSSKGASI